MEPLQFAYWLQGFAELNEAPPTAEQWQAIRDHLATVFTKVTPPLRTADHTWPSTTPFMPPYTPGVGGEAPLTFC